MLGGDKTWFLGRVKEQAYRTAVRGTGGAVAAMCSGTIDEYAQRYATGSNAEKCKAALFNKVKVCPVCGKPNGFTLATCNKCQKDLTAVEVSATPNLFTAFVLGIEKGPSFPLKISMRKETEEVMVFDDPLALSPLHFCAVPTTAFVPDWRCLLLRPSEGLRLSRLLVESCHAVSKEQFLGDPEWRASLMAADDFSPEEEMIMGYNYPPSQNQLHIQYMLPLLMPHQYMMFVRGVHFTYQRFFPVPYVEACLKALTEKKACVSPQELNLPIDAFVQLLREKCDVDYDAVHRRFMENVGKGHAKYARWSEDHFGGIYRRSDAKEGELLFEAFNSEATPQPVAEHAVFEQEKSVLQNYGKSADPAVPGMGYYSSAKTLEQLDFSFVGL